GVLARRRHGGGEAGQERQGIEVHGPGAVAERWLELDTDQVIGEKAQVLVGERRAQDVLDQRLAAARVVGAGVGRRVQREAQLGDGQRRGDDDAGPTAQRNRRGGGRAAGGGGRGGGTAPPPPAPGTRHPPAR